jgi:hypothetical protein
MKLLVPYSVLILITINCCFNYIHTINPSNNNHNSNNNQRSDPPPRNNNNKIEYPCWNRDCLCEANTRRLQQQHQPQQQQQQSSLFSSSNNNINLIAQSSSYASNSYRIQSENCHASSSRIQYPPSYSSNTNLTNRYLSL